MNRLLASIDERAERNGLTGVVGPADRYAPTEVGASPPLGLVLGKDVRTVIWATGIRPDYSWLHVPVFDRKGELKHNRGLVDAPGLHVLGPSYLRAGCRASCTGAEDDVRELGAHLADYLDRGTTQVQGAAPQGDDVERRTAIANRPDEGSGGRTKFLSTCPLGEVASECPLDVLVPRRVPVDDRLLGVQ